LVVLFGQKQFYQLVFAMSIPVFTGFGICATYYTLSVAEFESRRVCQQIDQIMHPEKKADDPDL